MEPQSEAQLLRIFIGESDKLRHLPLMEVIVREARDNGLAGATAWRGLSGFGPGTCIRTSKILDLSADLPVVIEITDAADRIESFLPVLDRLFKEAGCGGLVTRENVRIIRYAHGKPEAE